MADFRTRTQEINAEYWAARENQSERVAVAQLTLALARAEAAAPSSSAGLDAAWAEAEAAMTLQYRSALGNIIDRKRYDLSIRRLYETISEGVEQYSYEARITLPGIHYLAESGPTPTAALRALLAALSPVTEEPRDE